MGIELPFSDVVEDWKDPIHLDRWIRRIVLVEHLGDATRLASIYASMRTKIASMFSGEPLAHLLLLDHSEFETDKRGVVALPTTVGLLRDRQVGIYMVFDMSREGVEGLASSMNLVQSMHTLSTRHRGSFTINPSCTTIVFESWRRHESRPRPWICSRAMECVEIDILSIILGEVFHRIWLSMNGYDVGDVNDYETFIALPLHRYRYQEDGLIRLVYDLVLEG